MVQQLREIMTETVEQRLARALLRLARRSASEPRPKAGTVLQLPRQDLAEISGMSLFTVSRTISEWTRTGIVAGGRGRIILREIDRLSAIGDNTSD
jgi:CRP/FNR family transcriptional regulator, nitrogen oxide reductase regulator